MKSKTGIRNTLLVLALWACGPGNATAQSQLYPQHFNLSEVTLLDGPMRTAMLTNAQLLMQYDVDRLLTPYVRQSGLAATTDTKSPYYQWEQRHPSFPNWGGSDFNLDGHVGGHYLSAVALACAALHDDSQLCQQLRERMGYMVGIMADCQQQYAANTKGLRGFIGGQPINDVWTTLYSGDISALRNRGGCGIMCGGAGRGFRLIQQTFFPLTALWNVCERDSVVVICRIGHDNDAEFRKSLDVGRAPLVPLVVVVHFVWRAHGVNSKRKPLFPVLYVLRVVFPVFPVVQYVPAESDAARGRVDVEALFDRLVKIVG